MALRLAQFVCCGLRTAKSTVVTLIFFCATRSGNFVGVFLARLHVTYLMPKLWDTTPPRWRPEVSEKQKAFNSGLVEISLGPGSRFGKDQITGRAQRKRQTMCEGLMSHSMTHTTARTTRTSKVR